MRRRSTSLCRACLPPRGTAPNRVFNRGVPPGSRAAEPCLERETRRRALTSSMHLYHDAFSSAGTYHPDPEGKRPPPLFGGSLRPVRIWHDKSMNWAPTPGLRSFPVPFREEPRLRTKNGIDGSFVFCILHRKKALSFDDEGARLCRRGEFFRLVPRLSWDAPCAEIGCAGLFRRAFGQEHPADAFLRGREKSEAWRAAGALNKGRCKGHQGAAPHGGRKRHLRFDRCSCLEWRLFAFSKTVSNESDRDET